jgi:hypothetical protein
VVFRLGWPKRSAIQKKWPQEPPAFEMATAASEIVLPVNKFEHQPGTLLTTVATC